ncbi:TetR/AcrR family transcriptional regulator [Actinomadura barringtoniae]|uniref:TetR/AcrR family transcriptional regulator n=1 Tax=Actinomadura barringtoniae TaxID=1427535 RepID=A0A939T4Z6_9ACTN|nr:TetR/AcrR family transcriptional regulator [Actinomadura barringtoniae]MBO2453156.1 TetR/AcrR family transcriptional regulator [Actinomadura barringtoniae]
MAKAPQRRRRTSKGAEQVQADLLTAAARLFATHGFSDVAIADIARAADVATGTFYGYFTNKDDVLLQLRCSVLDGLVERAAVEPDGPEADSWWRAATTIIDSTVRFWFEDRDRSRVVLRGSVADDAAQIAPVLAATFAEGLRNGQQSGAVSHDIDVEMAAGLLIHGAFGLVYQAIVHDDTKDPATLIAGITALARHLLEPAGKTQ